MLDKDAEDFFNVSASLGGLDALQAQTQEHMAAVCGIPLVKLLGIQPAGLNASSEGELECFYTWIHSQQESFFTPNLKKVIDFIQLSEFGEIDEDIGFEYEPLDALDETELAAIRKTEAETGQVLINSGAISPLEERQRVAADLDAPYASLDADEPPLLPPAVKADIAVKTTASVIEAFEAGLTSQAAALIELRQASEITGLFSTISDEDISEAETEPPPPPDLSGGGELPLEEPKPEAAMKRGESDAQ
jgi:hypothetical protein